MATTPPLKDAQDHANPDHTGRTAGRWRPSRRALIYAALAFAIGLLLFLALWWRDRGKDFYRANGAPQTAEGQQFEPLPAPEPAADAGNNASGMQAPAPDAQGSARVVRQGAASTEAPAMPRAPAAPPANARAMAPADVPVPTQAPPPTYPMDALRNGESGTVLLRVHVDASGLPYAVDLVQSSHSRSLDRAATQAVKRWRFHPAQRNGQPASGEVQVPITFNAQR